MMGTTSAYAENTARALASHTIKRNYLRVRGEYFLNKKADDKEAELPPRTRRILTTSAISIQRMGTTSAYAENTGNQFPAVKYPWNYLRVRGEYSVMRSPRAAMEELPPRTRRIRCCRAETAHQRGTTSAYAENTCSKTWASTHSGNYLRVRGEYHYRNHSRFYQQELPPRTRRIPGCGGA